MAIPIWMTNHLLPDELRDEWRRMNSHKHERGLLKQFNDHKLGMFIHWGLYSIPSGIWNGKTVDGLGEWIMWMADIPREEYAGLADQFNPDKFDAAEWVGLAKRTGMKYIVVTAKHHDGFALWDSQCSDFNTVKRTASRLQPLDALYDECQKQGLGFGLYYSHVIDWYDGWEGEGGSMRKTAEKEDGLKDNPMNTWDPANVSRKHYFYTKAYPQLDELLERYPNLHCIWFDYWYQGKYLNPPEAFKFYKMIYDKQPNCLVNSRLDGYEDESGTLGDYITSGDNILLSPGKKMYWETPGTLNNTWGYNSWDDDWRSEPEILYWFLSIISRGGNYLLNIGPKPDGSIPKGSYDCLAHLERWMAINNEAVYGTQAWIIDREGQELQDFDGTIDRKEKGFSLKFTAQDMWFTCKDNLVYAIGIAWPENHRTLVKSIACKPVQSVSLLGSDDLLEWDMVADGLAVKLPATATSAPGFTLKIKLKREP